AGAQFADHEGRRRAAAAVKAAGPMQVVPLRFVFAIAVEHLHAMVLAVGDVDPACIVGGDIVGDIELPRFAAGFAPRHDELARWREFVHARVAVAVGNVDFVLRRQRRVRATVKRFPAHERGGFAGDADRQLDLARAGAAPHRMVPVIGQVEHIVLVDVETVRALEYALTPGAQEVAVAIEHDDRVLAAIEDVDLILAVNADGGNVLEAPAVGQFGPVLHHAIAMLAAAQDHRHRAPPCFYSVCPASVPSPRRRCIMGFRTSALPAARGLTPLPAKRKAHGLKRQLSAQAPRRGRSDMASATADRAPRNTAQIVIERLIAHGIDTLYCLPGVQNDPFFDALFAETNRLRPIHTRHEQGAAYMALGAAMATGKPAAYCVVPGPGFLNTAAALSQAYGNNAPVLAVCGQIPLAYVNRDTGFLHDIPDQLGIMQRLTKWSARICAPHEAAALTDEAVRQMLAGRTRQAPLECPLDVWGKA